MAAATASSSSSSSSSPRSLGLTTPVSLLPAFLAFFAFEDGFGELLAEFGVSATFCCALSIRYLYYEHTWANSKAIAITHGNGKRGKSSLLRSCAGLALPTPPFGSRGNKTKWPSFPIFIEYSEQRQPALAWPALAWRRRARGRPPRDLGT